LKGEQPGLGRKNRADAMADNRKSRAGEVKSIRKAKEKEGLKDSCIIRGSRFTLDHMGTGIRRGSGEVQHAVATRVTHWKGKRCIRPTDGGGGKEQHGS